MAKKGITAGALVVLILLVLSLVLLVPIIYSQGEVILASVDRYVCKLSAVLKYLTTTRYTESSSKLNCKVNVVPLETRDTDEINQKIAREMRLCWWQLGEGKLDFYSNLAFRTKTKCVICSKITSSNNLVIDKNKFEDYLNKNKISFSSKETYAEYFAKAKNAKIDFGAEDKLLIERDKPLYVVFSVIKTGGIVKNLWENRAYSGAVLGSSIIAGAKVGSIIPIKGTIVGAAGGAVFGLISLTVYKNEYNPSLLLIIGKEVVDRCDVLE